MIARNSTHVVSPVIESIHDRTFALRFFRRPRKNIKTSNRTIRMFVGGFDWNMQVSEDYDVLQMSCENVLGMSCENASLGSCVIVDDLI